SGAHGGLSAAVDSRSAPGRAGPGAERAVSSGVGDPYGGRSPASLQDRPVRCLREFIPPSAARPLDAFLPCRYTNRASRGSGGAHGAGAGGTKGPARDRSGRDGDRREDRLLAARGYTVLYANPRGSK